MEFDGSDDITELMLKAWRRPLKNIACWVSCDADRVVSNWVWCWAHPTVGYGVPDPILVFGYTFAVLIPIPPFV